MRPDAGEAAEPPRRPALRPLRRLLPFLAPYRWRVAAAGLALTVAAGTVLALGVGVRALVDQGFAAGSGDLLDRALLALLAGILVLALATFARFYLVSWVGERVVADLRVAVYRHLVGLDPAFFEIGKTAELTSRLTTDTAVLQVVIGSTASVFLRNLLTLVGGTVMLAVTSAKLTGLVFLVVPLVVAPILLFGRRVRRLSRASQDSVAAVGVQVDETLQAIRTVQAFGRESLEQERLRDRAEEAFHTALHRVRARAMLTSVVILLVFGAVGTVLWIGGHDVVAGRLTPGELTAFVFYAVLVAGATGAVSEVVGELQRAAGAAERLFELLETRPAITAPARPVPLPAAGAGRVAFEAVRFAYSSRPDSPALDGFSLAVEPGERVALVGPSGAGKSTVFALLLRFYDPQAGSIRLDGVELRSADPLAVRRRLGLVPQEPVIFSADVRENIRYGRPEASDAEVAAAAEAAYALDFIEALPQGFATFLGERGVRLSGGQRQRIAIARALLRDPAVLLLDEATSALDAESERMVQRALDRLMRGRTTLVIAHRLATVQSVDRIAVMEAGRLVAIGTHAQLVRQGGLYARLAALQFESAVEPAPTGGAVDAVR